MNKHFSALTVPSDCTLVATASCKDASIALLHGLAEGAAILSRQAEKSAALVYSVLSELEVVELYCVSARVLCEEFDVETWTKSVLHVRLPSIGLDLVTRLESSRVFRRGPRSRWLLDSALDCGSAQLWFGAPEKPKRSLSVTFDCSESAAPSKLELSAVDQKVFKVRFVALPLCLLLTNVPPLRSWPRYSRATSQCCGFSWPRSPCGARALCGTQPLSPPFTLVTPSSSRSSPCLSRTSRLRDEMDTFREDIVCCGFQWEGSIRSRAKWLELNMFAELSLAVCGKWLESNSLRRACSGQLDSLKWCRKRKTRRTNETTKSFIVR